MPRILTPKVTVLNGDCREVLKTLADGSINCCVWTVNTQPYKGAHFATFPPALIEPCILAGCPKFGTVLDSFGGSGTTGQVALSKERSAVLVELNPSYIPLINERIEKV